MCRAGLCTGEQEEVKVFSLLRCCARSSWVVERVTALQREQGQPSYTSKCQTEERQVRTTVHIYSNYSHDVNKMVIFLLLCAVTDELPFVYEMFLVGV